MRPRLQTLCLLASPGSIKIHKIKTSRIAIGNYQCVVALSHPTIENPITATHRRAIALIYPPLGNPPNEGIYIQAETRPCIREMSIKTYAKRLWSKSMGQIIRETFRGNIHVSLLFFPGIYSYSCISSRLSLALVGWGWFGKGKRLVFTDIP